MAEANELAYTETRDNSIKAKLGVHTIDVDTSAYRRYLRAATSQWENSLILESNIAKADIIFDNQLTWKTLLQNAKYGMVSLPALGLARRGLHEVANSRQTYEALGENDTSSKLTTINLQAVSEIVQSSFPTNNPEMYNRVFTSVLEGVYHHETTHFFQFASVAKNEFAQEPTVGIFCKNFARDVIPSGAGGLVGYVQPLLMAEISNRGFASAGRLIHEVSEFVTTTSPEIGNQLNQFANALQHTTGLERYSVPLAITWGVVTAGSLLLQKGLEHHSAYENSLLERHARGELGVPQIQAFGTNKAVPKPFMSTYNNRSFSDVFSIKFTPAK